MLLPSVVLSWTLLGTSALAGDITVLGASNVVQNDIVSVNSNTELSFSEDALGALNSGIPLVFDLDFRITRVRRYFPDKEVFSTHRKLSIERHALSDQFVVSDSITDERNVFSSLGLALDHLGRIDDLALVDINDLPGDSELMLALRLRLDIESLPAPMIAVAYLTSGWRMSTGWHRWPLTR